MTSLQWPVRRLILAFLAFSLAACANVQTVTDAPLDAGAVRSFEAPFERV
jgi:type IV pilus biogenesis protein CpaD/CtpE